MELKDIFKLYNLSGVHDFDTKDSSRGKNDLRKTYLVHFNDECGLAIKITNNIFTTKERIRAWKDLMALYLANGIGCPQIVTDLNGNISNIVTFDGEDVTVFAETLKEYKCVDEYENPPSWLYQDEVMESVGKIACVSNKLVPWPTAFCLYEKFNADDTDDENFENATALCGLLRIKCPEYLVEIENIWATYLQKRASLRRVYNKLPRATFQGDLNSSNIMIDEKGHFKGLIDFNLSGSEVILNYLFCESLESLAENDLANLTSPDFVKKMDAAIFHNLEKALKYYHLNTIEKEAFNDLYNIVIPFYWPNVCLLKWALENTEMKYRKNIIEWALFQLTRKDMAKYFCDNIQ